MTAKEKIDEYIKNTNDWRGEIINEIRILVHEVKPDIEEEWKWNSPVWSFNGMICSISAFKKHVSLTFFSGSQLEKETNLFNSSTDSKNTRSIILKENEVIKPKPLKSLIKLAIDRNSHL